jgi:hypothetical protein
MELTTKQIFSRLLAKETVAVSFLDKAAYESMRASLLRSFKKNRLLFIELGVDDPYEALFLQARYDAAAVSGTFKLEEEHRKTNIKHKSYKVIDTSHL